MTLFRGESQEVITRRLMLRDWPEDAARKMAAFLCDAKAPLPRWGELTGSGDEDVEEHARRSAREIMDRVLGQK